MLTAFDTSGATLCMVLVHISMNSAPAFSKFTAHLANLSAADFQSPLCCISFTTWKSTLSSMMSCRRLIPSFSCDACKLINDLVFTMPESEVEGVLCHIQLRSDLLLTVRVKALSSHVLSLDVAGKFCIKKITSIVREMYMNDPYYINTDLEIDSREDLTIIGQEFGEGATEMYNGDWGKNKRAAFEIAGGFADVNGAIRMFCTLVETLSPEARSVWDRSLSKTFSVGLQSGNSDARLETAIEPRIVERVAQIGASISFVVYPIDKL